MKKLRNGSGNKTTEQKILNKINEIVEWIQAREAREKNALNRFTTKLKGKY